MTTTREEVEELLAQCRRHGPTAQARPLPAPRPSLTREITLFCLKTAALYWGLKLLLLIALLSITH